jgi:cellulose synthase/poly-beta-1,6-N-acetylglucosamine synthase-like glycosyltransferase
MRRTAAEPTLPPAGPRGALARSCSRAVPDAERPGSVAVLIASKDGAASVEATIESVRDQPGVDVYVISDASTDDTVEVARRAGARAIQLTENVGKPGALFRALFAFRLTSRYEAIAILDDDTVVAPDFIARAKEKLRDGVAIVVGRTLSRADASAPWNPWLMSRAYSYWRYQVTIRRGQSAFNALNCISGSNSVYRSSVLAQIVQADTPYIVDDTFWTLEVHRRKLGRIVYAPEAHAWVQDPTTMRDWYRQNLRWLWGSFQGVRGHRVGLHATPMDFFYVLLIIDWALYVFGGPLALWLLGPRLLGTGVVVAWVVIGYSAWAIAAAIATRRWRMVVLMPAIIAIDWLYRVVFVHAIIKAAREPVVASCRWESPQRYEELHESQPAEVLPALA